MVACIVIPTFCIAIPTRCIAVPTDVYRCTDIGAGGEMLFLRIVKW